MKNYLNFETDIKNLESEIEKLKDPYNQEGLSEVDTQKISSTQVELEPGKDGSLLLVNPKVRCQLKKNKEIKKMN